MIKKITYNNKWIVSGCKDKSQDNNLVFVGFDNRVFKVFNTEAEADIFINKLWGVKYE